MLLVRKGSRLTTSYMAKIPAIFAIFFISLRRSHFPYFKSAQRNFRYSSTSVDFFAPSAVKPKSPFSTRLQHDRLGQPPRVFSDVSNPDVHSCTKMIKSYCRDRRLDDALLLFYKMPFRDAIAWNSMIKGCLDCGKLRIAEKVFDEMSERNVVSWTTMINGYFQFGEVDLAVNLFMEMPIRDITAWNSMVHGYCTNGRVDEALKLFREMPCRNVISWTSMVGGLDQNGRSYEALRLFQQMMSCVEPTSSTLSSAIIACGNELAMGEGLQIHSLVMKLGYVFDEFITTSLITFYAKCECVEEFRKVFHEKGKVHSNVVVWTSLLTGYSLNSKHEDALRIFRAMIGVGILPNQSTFTSVLSACCNLEALDRGMEVHALAVKLGFSADPFVGNSLAVLYPRCGSMKDGIAAFATIKEKNVVSWNSIIYGCAQHGCVTFALAFFAQMVRAKIEPDGFTLTGLLYACSHSGMLLKGNSFLWYFNRYKTAEVKPEHYACMVDIMGRCGRLNEAEDFIKTMPTEANPTIWLALLSACRMHSNLEIAENAAKHLLDLEPHSSAAYILMSNLYASAGNWSGVSSIRAKMKQRGIVKQQGRSWVTSRGEKHEFLSGDESHPLTEEIHLKLGWLDGKLKELGYVPDKSFALHDVEDEQKEAMLSHHSERLAVAFGLISTPEGTPITVMKNLRTCGDCHSAIKLIAKIVGREIILRDSSRFHHFRDGICSCGDYW